MIEYRMRYKHGDAEREFVMGEFNSEPEAMEWWKLMTSDGKHKPRDWILERRDASGWVVVATHDAGPADVHRPA